MSRFIFGMVVGAALLFACERYHLVHGQDGFFIVPKISNGLTDVYVDIRSFTLDDWRAHKPLAAAIMKSDRSEVLSDAALGGFRDNIGGLVEGLFSD
ncbi:MAG: hypothetical protein AAGJ40_13975 [Planctomycetota bacterium]